MSTVHNAITLLILICCGLLYFIGLGWLLIGPLFHCKLFSKSIKISKMLELSLVMISGIIINYGITLIFQSLKTALTIGGILALLGLICYLVMLFGPIKRILFSTDKLIKSTGIMLILGLLLGPIILLPLSRWDWDARYIWFFHAKMIYTAGALSQSTGWLHPSVVVSHVDYPNLVPALAAQLSCLMGFWNEYLPKLSLFFLLVPAVLILFTFFKSSSSFFFLLVLIPFSFSPKLWNGLMDGYLSLYFAISMLLLGRYYKDFEINDLISCAICLIPLLYLKNEGILALIAGIVAISLTLLLKKTKISIKMIFSKYWKPIIILLALSIPFLIWSYNKKQWGLTNDLELGTSQSFVRFLNRINDGSFKVILIAVSQQFNIGLILLSILLFASMAVKNKIPNEIIPIILAVIIYCLGIIFVYMVTPLNLINQLNDSVDRTILTVNTGLYVACYYIFSSLRKGEENKLINNVPNR